MAIRTRGAAVLQARSMLLRAHDKEDDWMYRLGDYVYPSDLPRRFLCRVAAAEDFDVPAGTSQILRLEPLEGPWPQGTLLVRLDKAVKAAESGCYTKSRACVNRADRPRRERLARTGQGTRGVGGDAHVRP
jgi:hypothetical protein